MLATVTGLLAAWAWEPADALLLTLPLFHTHGLVVGLHCALAAGATVLLRRRFEAAEAASELLGGRADALLRRPHHVRAGWSRSCAAAGGGSARPLPPAPLLLGERAALAETFAAFRELTGHDILERYGMTETGMNLSNLYAGAAPAGHGGHAAAGRRHRRCPGPPSDGRELLGARLERLRRLLAGAGEDGGELRPRRASAGAGSRPATSPARIPETGFVTLLGGRHELIISGGFNVYPREVEEVLAGFPGVREAAVVGRPHPDWGEVPGRLPGRGRERRHGRADRLLQGPDGRLQGAAGDPLRRLPAPERPGKSGETQAARLTD